VVLAGCNTLQSIEISKESTKTVYGQGQELSLSGLVVTGLYKKDSREVTNEASISGYNKDRPGKQTVTATLKDKSATFTVTVVPVESISILQPPNTTSFKQGNDPNWNGLSVAVKFENSAVPDVTVRPGEPSVAITGYGKDKAGTQTVTVNYYGKLATFEVTVVGLDSISVISPPKKDQYFTGQELDLTGLVVNGTWSDGSTARVDITKNELSGYDITRGERQNVTVTYSGKTATFPVTYIALSALSVNRQPTKTKYELGEPLDTSGIQIQGTWPGNSLALLDISEAKITGYDPLRAGEQRITVTVGGRSDTFTVTVTNPFEGTWAGQWQVGTQAVDGKSVAVLAPVTLTIDGSSWSLRTSNNAGETVELRGVCTPVSNTRATLQCNDRRGEGEVNRDSSTVMRLKNGLISREITLDRTR